MVSANLLLLNYDKTNFLQFRTKNSFSIDVIFEYNNKSIDTKLDTKFLGIIVDSTLQWKAHIDSLLIKLIAACYALRTLKPIVTTSISYGLFCLFPFNYALWHNFLGCFTTLHKHF
jgi:hypothetical protein